ncbi:EAL domain-containing protein [Marinomonas pollencensis]|uniref:PAS domain S-box-containing protein/diguanylate cyclase (GGDEF)-like protein n=1 Tax=Marinomonas pollencensis TaxID=491954 RepID=A0A3E0DL11_9GAMM|nr:bifunctional diguanylate cyclase/phosphodiesterase [Marinomonas pollencensis]REG83313.1 PAS domain S-box-containing protein/diguanylate cyclase (GGDEF)-like protein [Marinomonas pollencensis]
MHNVTGYSKLKVALIPLTVSVVGLIALFLIFPPSLFFTPSLMSFTIAAVLGCSAITSLMLHRMFMKNFQVISDLFHSIDDAIIVKDYQGDFTFCNKRVAYLYKSSPEKMVGKSDYYFTKNKEQADFFLTSAQEIMNRFQKEVVYESSMDTNTSETRHFSSIKIPYRDTQNALKIAIFARDITEVTCLKEEADKNQKRLEHVLDVSEEGLWEWNIQTNQVLHNKRWENIIGIESSQETFVEFEACIFPEDKAKVGQALDSLLTRSQPYNIEFRMTRPDGEVIWVWDRGRVAEFDENGDPVLLVGIILDITKEKQNQQKVERLAYHDNLTNLVNRTQLEVELEETIAASIQHNQYSAILFLDLDRFKLLNDSYGHHMGDKLLNLVATRLVEHSTEEMVVSRFGGDEFVIIYPLVDDNEDKATFEAQRYANELIEAISKTFFIENEIHDVSIEYDISISIGGLVFNGQDISTGCLLQLADLALYRAKASSVPQAFIFGIDMRDELTHSSQLLKDIRQSILDLDFLIYLQPKLNRDETLIGAEALVRWQHPTRGLLAPAEFIDQAEESNFIVKIGKQVLLQACEQLSIWQSSDSTKHLTIAVNLSAKQIWQSQFVDDFMLTLSSFDIDKSKLIVEVTETVLLQDVNDATEKMNRLKAYGITISLDDFGTGYSSLNYLHRLPIDEIKIDRSFINDFADDEQVKLMVTSIVNLANNFGLNVVAEGVENIEQFAQLKEINVDAYQGFFFSKPISLTDFKRYLLT